MLTYRLYSTVLHRQGGRTLEDVSRRTTLSQTCRSTSLISLTFLFMFYVSFYFLMAGLAFIVAACVLLFLPDSPATAHFLTEREKVVVLERVRDNQTGTRNKKWKAYQAKEA